MRKFILFVATVAMIFILVGCGNNEPERFIPPEGESIYVPTGATGRETGHDPVGSESDDAETWWQPLYMNPDAHTPYTVLGMFASGGMFQSPDDEDRLNELLEGRLFDSTEMPFPDSLIRVEDASRRGIALDSDFSFIFYNFNPDEHPLFNENGEEIGVIRVRYEGDFQDAVLAELEILTVEEFEAQEGFFESFEEAAYVLGAEFRLPTEHMERYGDPMFSRMIWGMRDGLLYSFNPPTGFCLTEGMYNIFEEQEFVALIASMAW
ncbi:MAG: hypothetical protein FWC70_09890 [Defluviitaleaceae bacterium]|nr:hypothetical protein [Defluviitaleaceae bacterium]